jgi:SAM-dependent methyltransferase
MEPSEFWSIGDYSVVGDLWSRPGRDLVASLGVTGLDVVDLATGTGVTAIAAAEHGAASVVGVDITPSLLTEAARRGEAAGVYVRWVEADVASVPLPDASADLVVSTFGLVFAADPGRAVAEARRLVRPGGRLAFTSWSPNGLFGALRVVMAGYFPDAPAPWHESPGRIRVIAGPEAEVSEQTFELTVGSPEEFVGLMERFSAPIVMARQSLGERWPSARADLLQLVAAACQADGASYRVAVPYWVTIITMPTI